MRSIVRESLLLQSERADGMDISMALMEKSDLREGQQRLSSRATDAPLESHVFQED